MSRLGSCLVAVALSLAGSVSAQDEPEATPDTAAVQQELAVTPGLTLRFTTGADLTLEVPAILLPGGVAASRSVLVQIGNQWEAEVRSTILEARAGRFQESLLVSLGLRAGQLTSGRRRPAGIPLPHEFVGPELTEGQPGMFRAVSAYATLGLDVRARLELKLDRLRNARCTAAELNNVSLGCRGGFPAPSFNEQFRVRAGGVVSNRVNVNVDFDSQREFSANNNINVFYQGLEDEILRRIEVGNVTFRSPAPRFVSAAIPGNSFGVQAEAQLGALEFRTIVAQQKGSAIRTRQFTVGEATTQPVALESRDLDFESQRFFFVVNPAELPSYPEVDILNINPDTLPPDLQVAAVRVYRLRAQSGQVSGNANLGGIDAVAVRPDSPQRVGPFSWELLVEGQDYFLDPSGTWVALGARLGADDFLAVSYVTVAGDTVGTFPSENGTLDTLLLVHEPRRGPEVPTYNYGMRNVYRLAGQGVDRATLRLTIRVGTSETPLDAEGTYLSRLGLALPTDKSMLDEVNRVFPRDRDPGGGAPIREYYVVFPHLTPFADSTRFQEGERNDSLYRTPTYLLRSQGPPPRYALQIGYEATGAGDRTNLSLGSFAVRAGSERIYVGNRLLDRGRDYEIDYGLGQVTFLRPDAFFAGATAVRVEFEENQLFDEAPKTIFGASGTYDLRGIGDISAIGVFQQERTINTRPILGFEPEAGFIGGLSTNLEFRSEGLTRLLDALPLISTNVPSALFVNGEVALSAPSANRTGAAYIEDFDQESAFSIPLNEQSYHLGSAPSSGLGLPPAYLGASVDFEPDDAATMVWQNLVLTNTGVLQFGPQDIDSTITLVGAGSFVETLLWLTVKPDTVGGLPDPLTGEPRWVKPHTPGPRWRSVTQALGGGSGVGADLSRVEFLEFWVLEDAQRTARQQGAYLVFDFGTVHEDAVAYAPEFFTVNGADTTYAGLQFVGRDRLDTEKDSVTAVFNALTDDHGIHGDRPDTIVKEGTGEALVYSQLCDLRGAGGLNAFPLGDLGAQCTVNNGRMDSEDLDGDNRLDVQVGTIGEDFARYVFPIGGDDFHVRDGVTHLDGAGRELTWRLYRIPFRQDTVLVGRPNMRQVEGLRLTVVAPDQAGNEEQFWLALARMRLTGAPWLKRSDRPLEGLGGVVPVPRGEVVASIVTTENTDLGYTPPPGVRDAPDRVDVGVQVGQVQINEKSLRLLASDLQEGERAEAFLRFTGESDKNLLNYRQLRVWARGRNEGWGEGELQFYIKVGRDEHNFYLYRTPARTDTWEPEVVVELNRWLELRALAEREWLSGAPPSGWQECGGDSTAYVVCDGSHLVHIRDPATSPPNLAAVSEIAVGMLRVGATVSIPVAELWVDDIRVTNVLEEVGTAAAIDVRLSAADVAEVNVAFSRRDDKFRQLGENATYVTDVQTRVGGLFRLDKLFPESWGLIIPITMQHTRSTADPFYLSRSDVRADALAGLRNPSGSATSYQVRLSSTRDQTFFDRTFLRPVSISAGYDRSENVASLSTISTKNKRARFQYNLSPREKTIAGAPAFLVNLVNSLPSWIKDSEFGKALNTSRLRWNPFRIQYSSALTDNQALRSVFRVPIELPEDSLLRPLQSVVNLWRNDVALSFRPFSTLSFTVDYSNTRDFQDYGDSTTVGRLIELERSTLLGKDIGFVRQSTLGSNFNVAPVINTWLLPRFTWVTNYSFNRDPNRRDPVRVDEDTAGAFRLPESLGNSRHQEWGLTLDLARMGAGIAGDSGFVADLFGIFLPADFTQTRDLRSSFDRVPFDSDLGYRLAFGGVDGFRSQNGVLATAARDATLRSLSAGALLPLELQLRVTYRDLDASAWQRRGGEQTEIKERNREWPSFTLSWVWTTPEVLHNVLSTVIAQAEYREQKTSRVQPSALGGGEGSGTGSEVRTENNSKLFSPSITLSWLEGITTTGRYTVGNTQGVTSGNITQSDREDWGATLAFAFRPPRSLVSMRQRIQTSISFSSSLLAVCLLRTGTDDCRTVSDSRRQQFDIRMDTGLSSALRAGLSFSHIVSDQRHISQKVTQTVLTIFGDLTLRAGEAR